jgi:NAD(P)-dependent dehydrogenase (short-subunit alcohol dehydrogenase family)
MPMNEGGLASSPVDGLFCLSPDKKYWQNLQANLRRISEKFLFLLRFLFNIIEDEDMPPCRRAGGGEGMGAGPSAAATRRGGENRLAARRTERFPAAAKCYCAGRPSWRRSREMQQPSFEAALIVGAGQGLSAALTRLFVREGLQVALAARDAEKLKPLCAETGASAFACDAADPEQVERLFAAVDAEIGPPDLVVYNASARARGPLVDLVPSEVRQALLVSAFGGFLVARQAAARMLPKGKGAILFTGASASVKGYPQSAPFAMGKFALRGLAQSLARELSPQGIHVGHFVIDGAIRNPGRVEPPDRPDSMLDPDAIALAYWQLIRQPRSAWSWEIELRPWVERF